MTAPAGHTLSLTVARYRFSSEFSEINVNNRTGSDLPLRPDLRLNRPLGLEMCSRCGLGKLFRPVFSYYSQIPANFLDALELPW